MYRLKWLWVVLWICQTHAYQALNLLDNGMSAYFPGTYIGFAPDHFDNSMLNHTLSLENKDWHVYGWLEPIYNASNANASNLPTGFSIVPNQMAFNQGALAIQKQANTAQTSDFDYGFKMINWWGVDYRFSTMQGIFSQQLFNENLLYGYDMPEAYLELFFPHLGQGTLLTIGRYQARGDIETLYAPDNYLISHSVEFMASAFTQMGVYANTRVNEEWSYMLGVHAGSDIAPWGASAVPTFMGFLQWISPSKKDSVFAGINSVNNGQYRQNHDNLQQYNTIWTHRFTPNLFMQTEGYYEYQFNARLGGNRIIGPSKSYDEAVGLSPIIPGYSSAIALLHYLEYGLSEDRLLSFRTDYLNDFQGQRTGFATQYIGCTLGFTQVLGKVWKIRPEVRYVKAMGLTPFDNDTQAHLILGLIDFVVMI